MDYDYESATKEIIRWISIGEPYRLQMERVIEILKRNFPAARAETEREEKGEQLENIVENPKSWIAWKREAERLQAILDSRALVEKADGNEK